eukprot:1435799-Rhodomonas_salina.1
MRVGEQGGADAGAGHMSSWVSWDSPIPSPFQLGPVQLSHPRSDSLPGMIRSASAKGKGISGEGAGEARVEAGGGGGRGWRMEHVERGGRAKMSVHDVGGSADDYGEVD